MFENVHFCKSFMYLICEFWGNSGIFFFRRRFRDFGTFLFFFFCLRISFQRVPPFNPATFWVLDCRSQKAGGPRKVRERLVDFSSPPSPPSPTFSSSSSLFTASSSFLLSVVSCPLSRFLPPSPRWKTLWPEGFSCLLVSERLVGGESRLLSGSKHACLRLSGRCWRGKTS